MGRLDIIYTTRCWGDSRRNIFACEKINILLEKTAENIREKLANIYSRELVNLILFEFYTKIGYIEEGLNVSRKTASKY